MAYGFLPHFLCLGIVPTTPMLGDYRDYPCARGLSRLFLCSGTVQATIVLGDCPDHHRARGLFRPLSCSETASTTLLTFLGDRSPRLHVICTHIKLRGIYFFSLRPCYKADISPSSKLGDYIGTMHLPIHLVSLVRLLDFQLNWEFFLDPDTTCLRHLLPGSGTKWAHFTLR